MRLLHPLSPASPKHCLCFMPIRASLVPRLSPRTTTTNIVVVQRESLGTRLYYSWGNISIYKCVHYYNIQGWIQELKKGVLLKECVRKILGDHAQFCQTTPILIKTRLCELN